MARQRKGQLQTNSNKSREKSDKSANSSSSNGSSSPDSSSFNSTSVLGYWKQLIACIALSVAISFGYMGYLETRINTPFDDKRVSKYILYTHIEATLFYLFYLDCNKDRIRCT